MQSSRLLRMYGTVTTVCSTLIVTIVRWMKIQMKPVQVYAAGLITIQYMTQRDVTIYHETEKRK